MCLVREADSEEHIVPRSIGGGLKLPILCKPCNEALGHGIDIEARNSGPIQHAALKLKDAVPRLWRKVGPGMTARSMSDDTELQVEKASGDAQIKPHRNAETGALQLPQSPIGERELRKYLASEVRKMRRQGIDPEIDVGEAVSKFRDAQAGETFEIPELGLTFIGGQGVGVEFRSGPPLSHRYPARIAYLLLVAAGVSLAEPSLENWRRYIRGEIDDPIRARVLIGRPKPPSDVPTPNHYFESVRGPGGSHIVDVILFGCWAWRCVFLLDRRVQLEFMAYDIDLERGLAAVFIDEEECAAGRGSPIPAPDPVKGWGGRR